MPNDTLQHPRRFESSTVVLCCPEYSSRHQTEKCKDFNVVCGLMVSTSTLLDENMGLNFSQ